MLVNASDREVDRVELNGGSIDSSDVGRTILSTQLDSGQQRSTQSCPSVIYRRHVARRLFTAVFPSGHDCTASAISAQLG